MVGHYTSEAPVHLINHASLMSLKEAILSKKSDGPDKDEFQLDARQFRPNIVIETDKEGAFTEDNFLEMRIGPLLLRTTGPCLRCAFTYVNVSTGKTNGDREPYTTLSQMRQVPGLGVAFGTYIFTDILTSDELYRQVLPENLGYQSFEKTIESNPITKDEHSGESFVRVNKGDKMMVRVIKEATWVKSLKKSEERKRVEV